MPSLDPISINRLQEIEKSATSTRKVVCENIKRILKEKEMSVLVLAEQTGLNYGNLRGLLNNNVNFGIDTLNKIAIALEVDVSSFWQSTCIEKMSKEEQLEEKKHQIEKKNQHHSLSGRLWKS